MGINVLPDYLLGSRRGNLRISPQGSQRRVEGHFGLTMREGWVYAFVDTDFADPGESNLTHRIVRPPCRRTWRPRIVIG